MKVARREFLRLGSSRQSRERRRVELSCERLYMRYLDSIDECTTADVFEALERDLRDVTTLRLTCTAWLSREDFHSWIEPLFDSLTARGVRVVFEPRL
jgi:hypothetical protein